MEKLIENLINQFSLNNLRKFFEAKLRIELREEGDVLPSVDYEEYFGKLYVLKPGEENIKLKDDTIAIYAIESKKELSERSSKKRQFELAKRLLSFEDGGFFVFYDKNGNFRFSFVHKIYKGRKTEFSHYKRYTYFVEKDKPYYTFKKALYELKLDSIENIIDAFSVEKVTEEFFEAFKYALNEVLIKSLKEKEEYKKKHFFALQLLSRILFIYFLQRKGWLKWKNYEQDRNYIRNLWNRYKQYIENNPDKKDTFYSSWLCSLFFGAFNRKSELIDKNIPEEIQESFRLMPFLNGGLFTKNEFDKIGFNVPDSVFEWLFEPDSKTGDKKKGFLEIFNFTIDESLPLDVEVAVDPEMLGKVYESLIAEEERGSIGIFYTPRAEIDLMCRLSLIEYLYNETKIEKNKLIDFVFMPQSIQNFAIEEARKVKSALDKVKIVDPAVGSASFMVGMMNILVELHYELTKKIENKEENLFALKQKIILENLYGVDVKDWAVMVGELRLWLSLIIDTDEKYMDIYTKPLLPNLSFKIRQGDSLVEEIGGVQISLRGEIAKYIPRSIADKIKKLIDRKNDFFSGKYAADLKELEEIEKLEQEIFTDILNQKIEDINKKITSFNNQIPQLKGQKNLYGEENKETKSKIKKLEDQIKELEKEKDRYEKVSNSLKTKKQKDYFLWEIDFAEVFATKGGFDIVIGNPPYVSQELIAPPLEDKSRYTEKEWKELKEDYKDRLGSSVKSIWKNVTIDKRSDLYVYFYYHGLSLLREGGIFCFINSNSWLDVGYGAGLQEFLLKRMRPIYIIDNLRKRSFKQADVNTVIVLIQRPKEELDDYTVKFVAFKKPFEEVVNAEVIKRLESIKEPVFDDEDFRVFPKSKRELLLEGSEIPEEEGLIGYSKPEELVYVGNKWGGKYLRAPEIYFKILEKGKGKLVRLGDIAEVRFGIKTGANEFFYLKPIGMSVKEVVEIAEKNPDALIRVKNGAGWEGEIEARFLKPVITEYEDWTFISGYPDSLIFIFPEINYKKVDFKAKDYIKYGEKMTSKGKQK
ncbi:MAG: DNA methyltransferase, partial [candidate division WOR-3 bacterium]